MGSRKKKPTGTYVCRYCGCQDSLSNSASVWWDPEAGDWVPEDIWGNDYCGECEGETHTDWVDFSKDKDRVGKRVVILLDKERTFDERDCVSFVHDVSRRYYLTGCIAEDTIDDMLILRKANQWQWEIVKEEATADA